MARYYLQLRVGVDEVLDTEGSELADLDAVKRAVRDCARDIMSGDMRRAGILDLRCWIDAEDDEGIIVYSLDFIEAVDIRFEPPHP